MLAEKNNRRARKWLCCSSASLTPFMLILISKCPISTKDVPLGELLWCCVAQILLDLGKMGIDPTIPGL